MSDYYLSRVLSRKLNGIFAFDPTWTFSPTVATNFMRYCLWVPPYDMDIIAMSFFTSVAATTDDTVDIGLFSADMATKLSSSGATAGKSNATAGPQKITVPTLRVRGGQIYYAAMNYGVVGGTAATVVLATPGVGGMEKAFGNTAGTRLSGGNAGGTTLPASLNPASATTSAGFALAVHES